MGKKPAPLPGVTRFRMMVCPFCGYRFDAAGTSDGSEGAPTAGDPTVCIECARVMIFNADLSTRRPHPGELETLLLTDPEAAADIAETQSRVRRLPPRRKRK